VSIPEAVSDFKAWIDAELVDRGAFTALVVLVEIGERSVTPVISTYVTVSAEIDWPEIVMLFAGVGIPWDGASFFPVTAREIGAAGVERRLLLRPSRPADHGGGWPAMTAPIPRS
jgi:hypothetical protein